MISFFLLKTEQHDTLRQKIIDILTLLLFLHYYYTIHSFNPSSGSLFSVCDREEGGDSTTPLSFSQFACDVLVYITWDLRRIKIHHSQIFLWKVGLKIFISFLDKRCFMEVIPVKNTYSSKIILITKEEKIDKSYYKRYFPCLLYKI